METALKRLPVIFVAALLLLLSAPAYAQFLLSAPAYAQSPSADLVRYTPAQAKVLIGVNVPAVRESFLFGDVMDFIRSQPANQDLLGFVLRGGFVDIEKEVDGLLIATPPAEVPTSPQGPMPEQDVTLAVRGKIDRDAVLASAKEKFAEVKSAKVGKMEVFDTGSFKFVIVDKTTLVLVAASAPYEAATFEAISDKDKSVESDKAMKEVIGRIKTSRGIWMATTETPTAPGMPVPPMKDMAMTVDIAGGLKLDIRGKATSADQAKIMAEQMEKLKNDNLESGMVKTVGARPLLANLQVRHDKDRLDISTRMKQAEFKTLIDRMKAMRGAPNGFTPPASMQPKSPVEGDEKKPATSGADADFN